MKTLVLLLAFITHSAFCQAHVFYDDDCSADIDCGVNFATLHKLADHGEITLLATVADSANPLSAPAMKVFNTYYGRPNLPTGANQQTVPGNCERKHCNHSEYLEALIARFDPGDTRSNYPDCVTIYRRILAAQPDASVTVVTTGFLTCLAQTLASPADKLSRLTGAQLLKAKVSKLVIMGGKYPQGNEFNLAADQIDSNTVFTTWTTPNGFSPIWLISFADGTKVKSGPPPTAGPQVNPIAYCYQVKHFLYGGSWDSMAILYAARGLSYQGTTYWTESGNGTVTMDLDMGDNTFSTDVPSGHHFLINALPDEGFSAILDGHHHAGFASESVSGSQKGNLAPK